MAILTTLSNGAKQQAGRLVTRSGYVMDAGHNEQIGKRAARNVEHSDHTNGGIPVPLRHPIRW